MKRRNYEVPADSLRADSYEPQDVGTAPAQVWVQATRVARQSVASAPPPDLWFDQSVS